ncbi:MAG: hypothetical protein HY560_01840 [Gemmatimonadetes bacterium]|nr:hypothetical protein [Gemmatimonadota bacterium]
MTASLQGRRQAVDRWLDWARRRRVGAPLVWIHAASVGEALTAEPVIRRLSTALPGLQLVLTYSSPSLARWPGALPVAAADFAPPEEPGAAQAVVASLAPDLLVFSRGDLWPELLIAAHSRGVPVAVLGATVRRRSRRLAWPARPFLVELMRPVRFVGAVTTEDAERWERLGVPASAISVTGDPRHDQVLERPATLPRVGDLLPWAGTHFTIVTGSVEEDDEPVVLGSLSALQRAGADVRLLLVPHDPASSAVTRLFARAARMGVPMRTWRHGGTIPGPVEPCVVVEEMGSLGDLYLAGTVAYVGGGFRRNGLHAIIEPAAYGLPVAFGSEYEGPDAERMLARGGAVALPRRGATRALTDLWLRWLLDPESRQRAGLAARGALQQGAASVTAQRLRALLGIREAGEPPPAIESTAARSHLRTSPSGARPNRRSAL